MRKFTVFLFIIILCLVSFSACSGKKVEKKDSLQKLQGQEFIVESTSPDGKYKVKAYKNSGGATVDWAVLCTMTDTETNNTKNIYWQYHESSVHIEWVDNDTVKINRVILDLPDETYDWRKDSK